MPLSTFLRRFDGLFELLIILAILVLAAFPAAAQQVSPSNGAGGVQKVAGIDGATKQGPANPLAVSGDVSEFSAAPTVTASAAYSANNVMGSLMTFSNIGLAAGRGGFIQSVTVAFKSAQTAPMDFFWCGASNPSSSTITDKTNIAIASADFDKCRPIPVSYCASGGTPSVCAADALAFPFTLSSGTTGYGFLVTRGTPTFASTSDVKLTLRVLR